MKGSTWGGLRDYENFADGSFAALILCLSVPCPSDRVRAAAPRSS